MLHRDGKLLLNLLKREVLDRLPIVKTDGEILRDKIKSIRCFVEEVQSLSQPRDDYRELLDLTLIFLGIIPSSGVKFRKPGPIHHARWMAKAIFPLKMYPFRDCFKLTAREEGSIREICIFIVLNYVKAWFTASVAPKAPHHDLEFIKMLNNFQDVDPQISQTTLKKFMGHSWYLSPELIALSFFDESLPVNLKRKMVIAVNLDESSDDEIRENCPKRLETNFKEASNLFDLDYFITSQCYKYFERFEIDPKFLKIDPLKWSEDKSFQYGLNIVKKLKVVNDPAERAVRLIDDYNNILTNKESRKQYLLQVVTEYRKQFPNANKETAFKMHKEISYKKNEKSVNIY